MPQERFSERSHLNQIVWANRIVLSLCVAFLLLAITSTPTPTSLTLPGASEPLPDLCYYKKNLNQSCSSCGLTRSTVMVLQGDFATAKELHTGGVWVAGFLVIQLLLRLLGSFRRFVRWWPWDLAVTLVLIVVCFTR